MSAIIVENLSKRYLIGHQQKHDTLRDTLSHGFKNLWPSLRRSFQPSASEEEFWALRDISFHVEPGEVVGIIGRNGAGKSTLLKILSRITEPTSGSIRLRGRVASLLEVGTGFHPELTGRENIFLNGAILGMSRVEIRKKFDEIVAFAEVERFLDTPVKRYSSGMYVRLAFAVAAHLDPEILIVDEVLAVGDAAFQKKCLGKMKSVSASEGRTVLFVSHNAGAIRQLTQRCLFLERGTVAAFGETPRIIEQYAKAAAIHTNLGKGRHATVLEASLVDKEGLRITSHIGEKTLWIEVALDLDGHAGCSLECYLTDMEGVRLGIYSPGHFSAWRLPARSGLIRYRVPLALPPLASGTYGIDVSTTLHGSGADHYVPDAVVFETSSLLNFPAQWELRKEYAAGYFILDAGQPVETAGDMTIGELQ